MTEVEVYKFVYGDSDNVKVFRGTILSEDEFTYTIQAEGNGNTLYLGKKSLIQATPINTHKYCFKKNNEKK